MKTTLSLLVTLAFASSLFADFPFDRQIHSATPDSGPLSGGTVVTLAGEFNFSGIADPCAGPQVLIGGVNADVLSYDETAIVVKTPPYVAGRFDVTVDRCGARGSLKNGFTYFNENEPKWEAILLPVYLQADLPGAFGSVWRTTLAGFNTGGDVAFTSRPDFKCAFPSPDAAVPCFQLVRHGSFEPLVTTDQHQPGRMVYVEAIDDVKRVRFNLRVNDKSRESATLGTELPVVYEDDAVGPFNQIVLLNVPLGEPYRQKLRIYRLDAGAATPINLFFNEGENSLGVRTVGIVSEPAVGGYVLYPGYVELDLNNLPELAGHSRTDIQISVTQGRYWAYVSVTNNNTQQVTHVTP